MEIWEIISIVLGVISAFFGVFWYRSKLIVKELKILLSLIVDALEDDDLTKEEFEIIKNKLIEILNLFKNEQDELIKTNNIKKISTIIKNNIIKK